MTGVSRHTVCWLVRHGQTAWNRERRYLSRTDVPLTTFGCRQAEAVAWRLRRQPVTVVVHSGLGRTEQTAIIIAAGRERAPKIEVDRGWREADNGRWEGLTYAELMARFPEEAQARFGDPWSVAPEGGETLAAVQRRVLDAWRALLQRHDGARIAIVTHATSIQLVLCELLRIAPDRYWQLRIDPGSISWVDLYPSAAIIRAINEVPPLRPHVAHEP